MSEVTCTFCKCVVPNVVRKQEYDECDSERLGYKEAEQVAIRERNALKSEIEKLKVLNSEFNKKLTACELGLLKILYVAREQYKGDRQASLLEETIEQIVCVDLYYLEENIDDVHEAYSKSIEDLE